MISEVIDSHVFIEITSIEEILHGTDITPPRTQVKGLDMRVDPRIPINYIEIPFFIP